MNPGYVPVRLDFQVRFAEGFEPNFYLGELRRALVRFLSPWVFAPQQELAFGGVVYKSVLLDLVEELEYVDYVTEFRMVTTSGPRAGEDRFEIVPEEPDAILVSAEPDEHRLTPIG